MSARFGRWSRLGGMAGLGLAVLLSDAACSKPEPTFDNPSIQWFEPDVREEAYGVDLDFDLSFDQDILNVFVDVHNSGDLLIGYRSADSSDPVRCERMMIESDRVDVLVEPYKMAQIGGVKGTATPRVSLVEPGDTRWWKGSIDVGSACSDITSELKSQHPTQVRVCFGLLHVPPEYVKGGTDSDNDGSNETEIDAYWLADTNSEPPVLLCSPAVDLPPEWYAG